MTSSSATLTTIRDRLEAALVDSSNAVWESGTLDEALRRALSELGSAWGEPLLLSGLDSAALTTLQAEDEGALIAGGEFYAGLSRAVDRLETPALNEEAPDRFFTWCADAEKRFKARLEKIRVRRMQRSQAKPAAEVAWNEDTPTW